MAASVSRSHHMFRAFAPAEASAAPKTVWNNRSRSVPVPAAMRYPAAVVKTTSRVIPGFVSAARSPNTVRKDGGAVDRGRVERSGEGVETDTRRR